MVGSLGGAESEVVYLFLFRAKFGAASGRFRDVVVDDRGTSFRDVCPCSVRSAFDGFDVWVVTVDVERSRRPSDESLVFHAESMIVNTAVFMKFATDATFSTVFKNNRHDVFPVKFVFIDLGVRQENIFLPEEVCVFPPSLCVADRPRVLFIR